MFVAYRDALFDHEERLNRLNVYPVPDGDTGTNMALTLDSVVKEMATLDAQDGATLTMQGVCGAVAHGSLMGARGNSGVILSQLLRGITDALAPSEAVGPVELAHALSAASDLAYRAVVRPTEGTILTVARAAAQGALEALGAAEGSGSEASTVGLVAVVEGARSSAAAALDATPLLLEALARAGVVDAGGAGYLLLFDALLFVLDSRPVPEAPAAPKRAVSDASERAVASSGHTAPGTASEGGQERPTPGASAPGGPRPALDLRYEVMYLLDVAEGVGEEEMASFKEVWAGVGDSIVVVGGPGVWNCHIHTDDVGAAIEVALDIGRPRQIRVTDLGAQVIEERWVRDAERQEAQAGDHAHAGDPHGGHTPAPTPPLTGVVAVCSGEGIGRILHSLGAHVVPGGQSMNPSTAELLEAVESLGSAEVVLLPNNTNVTPVALALDVLSDKRVRVVPTRSVVEGFACLLAYDPESSADANVAAMGESARHVISGEVTRAVRDATTGACEVRAGDWLGLAGGEIVTVSDSPDGAARALLERVITESHGLVTVIEGDGSTPGATRLITEWLHEMHPNVTTEVHHGGQPLYPYLLGIE